MSHLLTISGVSSLHTDELGDARDHLEQAALDWVRVDQGLDKAASEALRATSRMGEAIERARTSSDPGAADAAAEAVRRHDNARGWLDSQIDAEQRANARMRIAAFRLATLKTAAPIAPHISKCDGAHAAPRCQDLLCWRGR